MQRQNRTQETRTTISRIQLGIRAVTLTGVPPGRAGWICRQYHHPEFQPMTEYMLISLTSHWPFNPTSGDCPGEPKKKSKQTHQFIFQQLKNLRNAVLPHDSPSDAISGPRTSSSQRLKDRIARIRRRTSLAPDNAEHPADAEAPTSEEETAETRRPKRTLVSYNRLRSVLAVASNDPPVEQKKYYYARRNGKLVPTEPPAPSTTQHQRRRRNPFSRTSRGTASAEGQSSSTTPTTSPSQGQPLNTGQEREEDFEVECACCGFMILARSI
ncbi:hypothetical protein F5I97DRAFT_1908790 [Phlebopus sp. FC_14]|nr:hypothetical protein F5I97DRAFT_1908790 [Phlebopus sp. FC_14]